MCQDGPSANWTADAPWPQQLDGSGPRGIEGLLAFSGEPGDLPSDASPGCSFVSEPTGALRRAPFFRAYDALQMSGATPTSRGRLQRPSNAGASLSGVS